jgi:AraC-like DNA-binding protein
MTSRAQSAPGTDPVVVLAARWARGAGVPTPASSALADIWSAAEAAGLDTPGLTFASWVVPAAVGGALMPVLANAPSLDGMLSRLARFHPLFGSESLTYRRGTTKGVLDLRGAAGGPAHPESAVACFALVSRMLAQLGDVPQSLYVTLRRPRPPAAEPFNQVFPHIRFDGEADQLVVPAADLDTPLTRGDQDVLAVLDSFAEAQLRRRRPGWSAQVVDVLASGSEMDLDAVARELAVSPRALQGYLQAEGTSLTELIDSRRRHQALSMLATTNLTATQIAERVGLGSVSALNRATKRWTGVSPTEYRAAQRQQEG